jgi:heat shock protein HtpX
MNDVKTVGLLAFMGALLFSITIALGQSVGLALVIAFGFNFLVYFFSDKMALAASKARPVTEADQPQLYAMIRRLTVAADLPMPSVHLIDSPQPNAFATGRNPKKAAVAVTTGLMQMLNDRELEGVIGHELSHIKNRDILISSIAAMIGAAISIVIRMAMFSGNNRDNPLGAIAMILAMIVGPLVAMLLRFAISRSREFQADKSGAEITGSPLNLASALGKISEGTARIPMNIDPAHSQLFIDNPLKSLRGSGLMRMMSTHPPAEERIQRLHNMAAGIS